MAVCDNTPSQPPYLSTSLNNFFFASESSSGFRRGMSHFFVAIRNTTKWAGEKNKEQTNNKGLGQLKVQEEEFCNTAFVVHLQTNASVYF